MRCESATLIAHAISRLRAALGAAALAALGATPAIALDCETGIDGDLHQIAYTEQHDFGADWAIQIALQTLEDWLGYRLFQLQQNGQNLIYSDDVVMAFFNTGYHVRIQGIDLIVDINSDVFVEVFIEGYSYVGSVVCPIDGTLMIEVEPMITVDAQGDQHLRVPAVDVVPDNPAYTGTPVTCPLMCTYGSTSWGAAQCDNVTTQVTDLLNQLDVNLTETLGGLNIAEHLDTGMGWVDPFVDVRLSVVGDPAGGADPFVMLGGDLVAARPCPSEAYPLFDDTRFYDYRVSHVFNDAAMLISLRLREIFEAELDDGLVEYIEQAVNDSIPDAIDPKHDSIAFWFSGLGYHDPPCSCVMGDTEYWLILPESDPAFYFNHYTLVYINVSVLGFEPGPFTLQMDGRLDIYVWPPTVGGEPTVGVILDFDRANGYGPWYTDTLLWCLNNNPFGPNIDLQDAAFYQNFITVDPVYCTGDDHSYCEGPDGRGTFIPLVDALEQSSDMFSARSSASNGHFLQCPNDTYLNMLAFNWAYRWSESLDPTEYWASCGEDSDHDGVSDAHESVLGTDPNLPDTDGDLIQDGVEMEIGTDPLLCDSDADGANDWAEHYRMYTDPLIADSDGDSVLDGCEDAVVQLDPLNPDTDGDGFDDGLSPYPGLYCSCAGLPCGGAIGCP